MALIYTTQAQVQEIVNSIVSGQTGAAGGIAPLDENGQINPAYLAASLAVGNGGVISPSDSPPADDINRTYFPDTTGIYTNFSALEVDITDGLNIIVGNDVGGFQLITTVIDLAGYTQAGGSTSTAKEIEDIADSALSKSNEALSLLNEITEVNYSGILPFREYSNNTNFVTSDPNVTQSDSLGEYILGASGIVNQNGIYFNTSQVIDFTQGELSIEYEILSSGGSFAFGIGYIVSGAYWAYLFHQSSGLWQAGPFGLSNNVPGYTAIVGDKISFTFKTSNSLQISKNGTVLGTVTIPIPLSGTMNLYIRGNGSVKVGKPTYKKVKVVYKEEFDSFKDEVNTIYPFQKNSNFIATFAPFPSVSWVKSAVLNVQLFGFQPNEKISLYFILNNKAGRYQLVFYRDLGDGSGASKEVVIDWDRPGYLPPSGIDTIEGDSGLYSFKAKIDWSAMPVDEQGSIAYNSAGFDPNVFLNFKEGVTPPLQQEGYRIDWKYNNEDSITTGTDVYKIFTVLPNTDTGGTIGCTGLSYNPITDEFVVSYYAFSRSAKLWMFKRSDLIEYSASGTIVPIPTRSIDVSSHLYHLQGNVYDPELRCYWLLGSATSTQSDTGNVLVKIDEDGNMLEKTDVGYLNFQAGMLALSPNLQNIIIKPNNKDWFVELNKFTKSEIRRPVGLNSNEGLGVDYQNSKVWIGGNFGNIKKYDYSTMVEEASFTYATLPDEIGNVSVEGVVIDPVDSSVIICADCYLHGGRNNGNAMWVYDFENKINKSVRFPEMIRTNGLESMIIDFGSDNDLEEAELSLGEGSLEYRGSNTAPTVEAVNRTNWRDKPYYGSWGSTPPSAWSSSFTAYRYMQVRKIDA